MTVLFDTYSGRLRLDQESFDNLAQWARGADGTGGQSAALREAGVIDDGRPHRALAPGLAAVADPICVFDVTLIDRDRPVQAGTGWASADGAAVLLDLPGGLREFVVVHPAYMPAALARITRIGPRPRLGVEPVPATVDLLQSLFDDDPAHRVNAVHALTGRMSAPHDATVKRALEDPSLRRWRIGCRWRGPDGPEGRSIDVVDGHAGVWLIEIRANEAMLWPTTPTAVWHSLLTLLPRDDEIA